MSVKVSSWVWHGDETANVSGNEMILLLALADVADDNGRCRYMADEDDLRYSSLAKKARVSRSTLIRLLAGLREAGLVEQTRGVKGKPNEFRLLVPWAQGNGANLTPNRDSVSSAQDSVSSETRFGVISDDHSSYRRKNVGDVDLSSEVAVATIRPDVERLLDLLDEEIARNGGKKPTRSKKNIDAARLLLDRDGRTVEQVEAAIRWCQADEFWRSNILSMSKLREKYDQLRLAAARSSRRPAPVERAQSVLEIGARLQQQADAQRRAVGA